MPTKIEDVEKAVEDVEKAVEPIIAYCDEFDASFTQRMEPLIGDDINHLVADKECIGKMRNHADTIRYRVERITALINQLIFK